MDYLFGMWRKGFSQLQTQPALSKVYGMPSGIFIPNSRG